MWDSVKAAAKNLGRKKLRSSLTILGITIGVASVILIGNIGQCGTQAVNAEVNSLGLGGYNLRWQPGGGRSRADLRGFKNNPKNSLCGGGCSSDYAEYKNWLPQ